MAIIYVAFTTRTGEAEMMAQALGEGVRLHGSEAVLGYIPPALEKREQVRADHNWRLLDERCREDYPLADAGALTEADGAAFGSPTVHLGMSAEMKLFLDTIYQHEGRRNLLNKPAATFTVTHSCEGDGAMTSYSMWAQLAPLGFLMVGMPQQLPQMIHTYETHGSLGVDHHTLGSTPRLLSEHEWNLCHILGARLTVLGEITKSIRGDTALTH